MQEDHNECFTTAAEILAKNVKIRYFQGKINVTANSLSRVIYMEPSLKEDKVPLLEFDVITNTLIVSP